eukprot:6205116-Pleurochrysis_carterae.AAC.1
MYGASVGAHDRVWGTGAHDYVHVRACASTRCPLESPRAHVIPPNAGIIVSGCIQASTCNRTGAEPCVRARVWMRSCLRALVSRWCARVRVFCADACHSRQTSVSNWLVRVGASESWSSARAQGALLLDRAVSDRL